MIHVFVAVEKNLRNAALLNRMHLIPLVLISFVSLLHFWFLILEMFLWQKPIGLKTFKMTVDQARATGTLAANQGLYNGFLAVGLLTSFFIENTEISSAFRFFFLSCVIVAGTFGAATVNKRIFFIQAGPAFLAILSLKWITH
jgi:putative membrane protein